MLDRFPEIEPFDQGMLDVGDGQLVYWEASGNPSGKPAIALHGGPGSGGTPGRRRSFDPEAYLFVQFDQRGCGRSTPAVAEPGTTLEHNTTWHLVADIERLREHLGIERWLVWGGSWGVTLALAYAALHPERVTEMVLVSVTVTRRCDVHWLYHEVGRYFPEEWARFREGGGYAEDLVVAYDRLLNRQPDPVVRAKAAHDWRDWEDAVQSLEPGWAPNPRYADPAFRMTFARLCAHYFSHGAWLDEDQLLAHASRLAGIPGALIHGRLDLGGPADVPWMLAKAWPGSELYFVGTGHAGGSEMTVQMMAALSRYART
jgi:proline iminopeptidase